MTAAMPAISNPYSTAEAPRWDLTCIASHPPDGRGATARGRGASTPSLRSGAGAGREGRVRLDRVAGAGEGALHDRAEGHDRDDDDGGDAGDEQAVLDGRGAALLHLGEAGVEQNAEVV